MNCFWCREDAGRGVSKDAKAVLCSRCVQKLVGAPDIAPPQPKLSAEEKQARKTARAERKVAKLEKLKTAKRGRGRGWHLKRLFEFDGEYFSMGKPITAAEAMQLKKAMAKEITNPNPEPKRRGRKPKVHA